MKIVLDTNVIISGIFWKGAPNQVFKLAEDSKIETIFTMETLNELLGVLNRKKFSPLFEQGKTNYREVVKKILDLAKITITVTNVEFIKDDPTDNIFLSCALVAGADFIISGDQHLLKLKSFHNIPILSPSQFLNRFRKSKKL